MQVASPLPAGNYGSTIGGPLLDNCLTVLSVILTPIKSRPAFLHHTKPDFLTAAGGNNSNNSSNNTWVVMDSSGDEEEDMLVTWCNLEEQDVVEVSEEEVW